MEDRNRELTAAVAACLSGVATEVQRALVERWKEGSERNRRLWERMGADGAVGRKLTECDRTDTERGWRRIEGRIGRRIAPRRSIYVAAACAAAIAGVIFALRLKVGGEERSAVVAQQVQAPAGAQLIMADGSVVAIDQSGDMEISEDGTTIYKDSTHIDYSRNAVSEEDAEPVYNELRMPNGMTYTMTLSDGTQVFLNAESRLRFPVAFSQNRREVEFEGEAYFSVAKNPDKPFVIKTGGVEVAVLGTEFNLRAYGDEREIVTTLVSGKVQVRGEDNKVCDLAPGHQAVYRVATGEISTQRVDVDFYTAWCRSEILFKDTSLEDIMRNLSRWYDIEYEFRDRKAGKIEFGGSFKHADSIEPILDMIRRTGLLDVERSGRKIYFSSRAR